MGEMDAEVIKTIEILFDEKYAGIRKQVFIILGIWLFLSIISSLLIPIILNNRSRKNEIKRQKIERKLQDIELMIDRLKEIQVLSISDDSTDEVKMIKEARELLNRRSYRFPESMRSTITELLDYYSDCLARNVIKNQEIESDYFESIFKEYEKLA